MFVIQNSIVIHINTLRFHKIILKKSLIGFRDIIELVNFTDFWLVLLIQYMPIAKRQKTVDLIA